MDARSYTDFDLVIEQVGDRYRARVISSPAGQAAVEFDSLFSPLELENFVLRMGRPQRGMRRIDSPEMSSVRTFGTRLFRAVFKDDVYACYLRSLDEVLDQNRGLRIRLRIDVPAFHDLPWEYLYNPQIDQFLALSRDTPIVRYIELPYKTEALPLKPPLKILVMISSPQEYPPLDVEEEWQRLNRALQPLIDRGQVSLMRLERPTLRALQGYLRREHPHIVHFIGHGKYSEREQDGMILLEDDKHRGVPTNGQQLGAILHDEHNLRLVVLNACEGARTSAEDPYTGVAQTLVRQGLPAVLAMQFEIFEDAAVTLAQEFYGAIADGYPVDAALSEARKAIFASNNDVEWGTPVLFMRIPSGVLFRPQKASRLSAGKPLGERTAPEAAISAAELKAAAERTEREAAEQAARERAEREAIEKAAHEARASELDRLYDGAKEQMARQDWQAAINSLERIQAIDPAFPDAAELLVQAVAGSVRAEQDALERAERDAREKQAQEEQAAGLSRLYDEAQAHLAVKDWPGAIASLERIQATDPGFRDAAVLLEQAEAERQRHNEVQDLLSVGQEMVKQSDWPGAVLVFQQLLILAPDHEEAQQLLREANARIVQEKEAQERQERLAELYKAAGDKMAQKDWAEAIGLLEKIEADEPGFRDVKGLLEQARTEKKNREEFRRLVERGKKFLAKQEWAPAAEVLRGALALQAGDAEGRALLAEADRGLKASGLFDAAQKGFLAGRYSEAIAGFQAVLELDPAHAEAARLLAYTRSKLAHQAEEVRKKEDTQPVKAVSRASKPLSLPEEVRTPKPASLPEADRGEKVRVLLEAAEKNFLIGQYPEAIAKYQAVLELDPAHAEAIRLLAYTRSKLAKRPEVNKPRGGRPGDLPK
jgi:outer membrane protein assembly factor BamD (BamD/ComL family)